MTDRQKEMAELDKDLAHNMCKIIVPLGSKFKRPAWHKWVYAGGRRNDR